MPLDANLEMLKTTCILYRESPYVYEKLTGVYQRSRNHLIPIHLARGDSLDSRRDDTQHQFDS